ncbi:MAG: triose-phosphate isomerase [Patescibacteria group bacterium]|jgi:triosephosphate isomerase
MNIKPLLIGNWKMNLLPAESVDLAHQYKERLAKYADRVTMVAAPSFTSLIPVRKILTGSPIRLACQDVAPIKLGPLTGEVAADSLAEIGVEYAIIGHSERRHLLGETNLLINAKVKHVIRCGLVPVICVGENLAERNSSGKEIKVTEQVKSALEGIGARQPIVIAYEPVWAISTSGSGLIADPDSVAEMAAVIYQALIDLYPIELIMKYFTIIYGGSVDETNAVGFLKVRYINGALIGAASLDASRLSNIIASLKK